MRTAQETALTSTSDSEDDGRVRAAFPVALRFFQARPRSGNPPSTLDEVVFILGRVP